MARIGVFGGGIVGCIAAYCLTSRGLDVVLADPNRRLAEGSTAKNQGRAHLGSTGLKSDPEEVTSRKVQGNRLLRAIPGIWDSAGPAIYAFERGVDSAAFKIGCLENKMDVFDRVPRRSDGAWLRARMQTLSVGEFSWNPAKVALQFARLAQSRGCTIYLGSKTQKIKRIESGLLEVACGNGDALRFDLVVNTASKYCNTIQFEDREPLLDLEYFTWPVMVVSAELLPKLDNVMVVVDRDSGALFPSAIPHGAHVTIDCKTTPRKVDGPDDYPKPNPRPHDKTASQELQILEEARRVFRPIWKLNQDQIAKDIKFFYGVHARRKNEPFTSDIAKTYVYDGTTNYLVRHGGLATTALLDAIEAVEEIEEKLGLKSLSRAERLLTLCRDMGEPEPPEWMIYER